MNEYIFDHSLDKERWNALDEFTKGYIECAFWTGDEESGIPIMGLHDLSDDALKMMKLDCHDFQEHIDEILNSDKLRSSYDAAMAGHDFWLTRNRHGAGFWDRGFGIVGEKLTEVAHCYGECDLYVGDDGKVYVS